MVQTYSLSKQGSTKLSTNFSVKEFKCKDGSDTVLIDSDLVAALQQIRDHFNKPVHINSAYRTTAYNKKIGGSSASQHCKGTAADIYISGVEPLQIALYATTLSKVKGIGLYSRATAKTDGFVHIDTRATKSHWISKSGTKYLSVSSIMPTLRKGNKDSTAKGQLSYAVTVLQRHLGLSADGIFGVNTEKAVKEFQQKNNLTVDGIVGAKTWACL